MGSGMGVGEDVGVIAIVGVGESGKVVVSATVVTTGVTVSVDVVGDVIQAFNSNRLVMANKGKIIL